MANNLKLAVETRSATGTAECRRLRNAGLVPGVVYNSKCEVTPIQLNEHEFGLMLRAHGDNMLLALDIDGKESKTVLLKEVQREPVRGGILHIDLIEVSMTEKIQVNVPIELIGEAAGTEAGGILEQLVSEIEIECLPGDLVEKVQVDVSSLNIGQHISVSDLPLDANVAVLTEPSVALASVAAPRLEEEEEEEKEEEDIEGAAEPEVVGSKEEKPEE